jgi:hypothetical protein
MRSKVPPKEVQEAAEAQMKARHELELVRTGPGPIDEATLVASRKLAITEQMYEMAKRVFSPEVA